MTNGWDISARRKLTSKFGLDFDDFEERHQLVNTPFETGRLDLEHYLDRTVFYAERAFSKQAVRDFMFAQSQPYPESLAVVERLAKANEYFMAILNNESTELNQYRISQFGLRKYFVAFLSSCYLGVRKPDQAIYKLALEITQRAPEQCVFIDDRSLNVECARREGMRAIQFQNPTQLQAELQNMGIEV